MNSFIRNYFGFNRKQRNGLLVLVCISFVLLLIRIIYPYFITPDNIQIKNLPLVERRLDSAFERADNFKQHHSEKADSKLFLFDPNSVSYEQLLTLGFREKTARTFLKYRDKGFVFKEKKDLQKIYGVSDELYEKLEPYVKIETVKELAVGSKQNEAVSVQSAVKQPEAGSKQLKTIIELNSCDSAALIALPGVGSSYARRILKYRASLGGFVSAGQVKEVYGFPEELFEKIKSQLIVNAATIKLMKLNSDDFKTINRHPYISYELTKVIFDWRRKTTLTAINLKAILNDDALYNKLLPYVSFE